MNQPLDVRDWIDANFARLQARLLRLAHHRLGSRLTDAADEEDLVQQALAQAIACSASFHGHSEWELLAWLEAIVDHRAANLIARAIRTRAAQNQLAHQSTTESPDPNEQIEVIDAVAQALMRLPEEDRDLLVMRFWNQQSWDEISKELGLSTDAARKRATRLIEDLNKLLDRGG